MTSFYAWAAHSHIDQISQFDMRLCMDWRSSKFDWNRARAFLVTAEEGSLSAAARALGVAQPTLGRQVDALEEELGVILFERVGRGLTLTPSGQELLEHVRAMGEAAGRFSLTSMGQAQAIEGTVKIAASEAHAMIVLPPILAKLRLGGSLDQAYALLEREQRRLPRMHPDRDDDLVGDRKRRLEDIEMTVGQRVERPAIYGNARAHRAASSWRNR